MNADLKIVKQNLSFNSPDNSNIANNNSHDNGLVDNCTVDHLASVHKDAKLGKGCIVGPYAIIEKNVVLGKNCIIHAHAVISGPSFFGDDNEIFPFAVIGEAPQDLRHKGEPTSLKVGNRNIFREHVTVSRGTIHGGAVTVIGDENMVMAYSHIAHDCIIGNRVVMANNATLAGHVEVQDFAVFGGSVSVGSFLRIGESAMLGAGSMIDRDVAPFSMVAGDRAALQGINSVGMTRRGFDSAERLIIKRIVKMLKRKEPLQNIINEFSYESDSLKPMVRLIEFLQTASRGITR